MLFVKGGFWVEKPCPNERKSAVLQHEKTQSNIAFARCHGKAKGTFEPVNTGFLRCEALSPLVSSRGGRSAFGELACHKMKAGKWRATRRASEWSCTWRAPSSPHLACGLNGSFFLRPCGQPNAALAGVLLGVVGWSKACGTLHRGGISLKAFKGSAVEGEGGSLKKSNFSNLPTETVWRPRIPWALRLQKGVTEK